MVTGTSTEEEEEEALYRNMITLLIRLRFIRTFSSPWGAFQPGVIFADAYNAEPPTMTFASYRVPITNTWMESDKCGSMSGLSRECRAGIRTGNP